MPAKRKAGPNDERFNKRNRLHDEEPQPQPNSGGYEIKARLDPVTGQRGAFPGLDDDTGEENLFYGPAEDGLEYLRMVRAEASTVPNMLFASSHNEARTRGYDNEDGYGNDIRSSRFWADEAIIAAPENNMYDDLDKDDDEEEQDPQDAYYKALLARFVALRAQLSNFPPVELIAPSIDPQMRQAVDITARYKQWLQGFLQQPPSPQYVACLSQSQIILGLERLEKLLTKRNLERSSWRTSIGAWAWSLLAKCRDKSEVDGDDTGVLRSLAKTAQGLGRKLRIPAIGPVQDIEAQDEIEDDEDIEDLGAEDDIPIEGSDEAPADPQELEAARARLMGLFDATRAAQSAGAESSADRADAIEPMLMLLDSIVTIVGELYGQRDLLEQRAAW